MRLSKEKKDRIAEQILSFLFHIFPKEPFTSQIAKEIVRDEEFTKALLFDLKEKGLVIAIRKNKKGINFSRRLKWRISPKVYEIYKNKYKEF